MTTYGPTPKAVVIKGIKIKKKKRNLLEMNISMNVTGQ